MAATKRGRLSVAYLSARCTPAYKRWMTGFARKQRSSPSKLIREGLAALAESKGHRPPPAM